MRDINVLVVEPDPIRRRGIVACLSQETDLNVAGKGGDFVDALEDSVSASPGPGVLIINIDQQPTKSIKNWAILRSMLPGARIVALTYGEDDRVLEAALAAGFNAIHPPSV
jgi:DNA-binding NarL/FixJ family response regulator